MNSGNIPLKQNSGNPLSLPNFKNRKTVSYSGGAKVRFDLLQLHSPEEDTNVRKLLRVYSVIPRFSRYKTGPRAEQAVRVNAFLRGVNQKLNKEIGFSWKDTWLKSTGFDFAKGDHKDWFIGRASIGVFRLPHQLDSDLAYLLGAILGDGHNRKDWYTIAFEVSEKWLTEKFSQKITKVFQHKLNLKTRMDKETLRYLVRCDNKPAVRLFTKYLGVPRGKKSHIICVPDIIKKSDRNIRLAFLEGVFDTEGCIRRKGLRITSASKDFRDGLCDLLSSVGEKGHIDEWINKKYNKKYYGLQYYIRNLPFIAGVG